MCLEWHLRYEETSEEIWTIDIMHIKNESPNAGMIEQVADSIQQVLTNDMREKILKLKHECYTQNIKVAGIEIYKAVIEHQIQNFEDLMTWKSQQTNRNIYLWKPKVQKH